MAQITIVRGAVGSHEQLLDLGEPAWQAYARDRGYAYVSFRGAWQSHRPPAWNKILWLQAVLSGPTNGVLWADADTLLADPAADLAESIPEESIAMGWYEQPAPHFNSGVMAIRNDPQTRAYLRAVWDTGHPGPIGWAGVPGRYEQPALNHHAAEFGVTRLAPQWHTIRTIGQSGGVIAGFHGDADRLRAMALTVGR